MFWEPHLKGEAKGMRDIREWNNATLNHQMKGVGKMLLNETKLWIEEWKKLFDWDVPILEHRELFKLWDFTDPAVISRFIVSYDALWEEGYSNASFTRSSSGFGLFSGFLDTDTLPVDRTIEKAGWAAINSPTARRSFYRSDSYDWGGYTHLRIRVRGDGRKYNINIRTPGTLDLTWFDMYSYTLYTHGGPYWQEVRIPFSKFYFQYKGALQDVQLPPPLFMVSCVSITLTERVTGPFALEIDYIGLEQDHEHNEEHAYEAYAIKEAGYHAE